MATTHKADPSLKKPHLKDDLDKKRSRPVTQPLAAHDDDDDDGSDSDDAFDDFQDIHDDNPITSTTPPLKDPNAARESHKAQRALLSTRRAHKPNTSLLSTLKPIWSQAHQKSLPTAERKTHIKTLMDAMRGKVKEIVLKHDANHIVVKHGRQRERDWVAGKLKGCFKKLAQNSIPRCVSIYFLPSFSF